jgi:YD repeat-containing protein
MCLLRINTHRRRAEVDALGRTVRTTEHIDKTNATPVDNVVMQYKYDVRGNLVKVIDPLGRVVFEHEYDLRPPQKGDPRVFHFQSPK